MLTLLPGLMLLTVGAPSWTWRSMRRAALVLVFTSLPISLCAHRYLRLFNGPYLFGAEWTTVYGAPLSPCLPAWFRTWATGRPAASDLAGSLYCLEHHKLQYLYPTMWTCEAQARELRDLVRDLEVRPPTDAFPEFCELAVRRRDADPWAYYVRLPLQRARNLFAPLANRDQQR